MARVTCTLNLDDPAVRRVLTKRRLMLEGRAVWRAPYGYRRQAGEKGVLVPDPEKARIVRLMFEQAEAGAGILAITRMLNGRGIPSPDGMRWASSTVGHILRNPIYAGRVRIRLPGADGAPEVVERQSPLVTPIITPELFDAVQHRLAAGCRPRAPVRRQPSYLRGLCRCACGRTLDIAQGRWLHCPGFYEGTCGWRQKVRLDAMDLILAQRLWERFGAQTACPSPASLPPLLHPGMWLVLSDEEKAEQLRQVVKQIVIHGRHGVRGTADMRDVAVHIEWRD